MDRNVIQIVIKPGLFGLATAATIGFILGQTSVYVKTAKSAINKNEETNK